MFGAAALSRPSFVDYVAGGCELRLQIAIDYTGRNGDPRQPGTLHNMHHDGRNLNEYETAITTVGSVVAQYDHDQAKYGGLLRNCFQVGGASALSGISGVLEAYRSAFRSELTMSGPGSHQRGGRHSPKYV